MDVKQDTKATEAPNDELVIKLRVVVNNLLEQRLDPSDITFSLAYLTTELGIFATKDKLVAVPILMNGIIEAIKDEFGIKNESQEKSNSKNLTEKEDLTIIH